MSDWITIKAQDGSGSFRAYVAAPVAKAGPAIVAIQEIFGVNDGMRQICHWLADEGYFAICPDLFWRQEPGIDLSDQHQAHWTRAFDLFKGFDSAKGIEDIATTIATARQLPGASGKVGAIGYCLGGQLAYLAATKTDVDASVGYYGVGIADLLDQASHIKNPLLLHIAGKDEFVPAAAQAKMHEALDDHPLVTLHDYPQRDHAFARPNGVHHHAADARTANDRSLVFFNSHL